MVKPLSVNFDVESKFIVYYSQIKPACQIYNFFRSVDDLNIF